MQNNNVNSQDTSLDAVEGAEISDMAEIADGTNGADAARAPLNIRIVTTVFIGFFIVVSLFIIGIMSGIIKINNIFNNNANISETVTPTLTINPDVSPTFTSQVGKMHTVDLPEYKMTMEYPDTWGFIRQEETEPSYKVAYEFFTVANDQLQFTIDIVDGGILDNFCSGAGSTLSFTDIVIAGQTEKIGKCFVNGVFSNSYSAIDNFRFGLLADKDFSNEALEILKTIKYTSEVNNNVK